MPVSFSRIGRVDWSRNWARACREKAEHEEMVTVIARLAMLSLFGTGMLTSSAVIAEQQPVRVDGSEVSFGLFVFVTCVIGAIGFTWTAAVQWSKLRGELRDAKRDIRTLKRRLGVPNDDEEQVEETE